MSDATLTATMTTVTPPNIHHIRLTNGEEIFGHVERTDNGIIVHKPLQTTEMESDDGSITVGLTSYLPFADDNFCYLNDVHVITSSKVHPEIERFYFLSCHFTGVRDERRLEEISLTNMKMANMITDEIVEASSSNGSYVMEGTEAIN